MIRKYIFILLIGFIAVSCTDTAATYREAMELKKLTPTVTLTELDNYAARIGLSDVSFTAFNDDTGELRRVLVQAEKNDTIWIDDHFYTNEKPLYYTHTLVFESDTVLSCSYFFHAEKCIKRTCAFGDYETEESVEMEMDLAIRTMKDFTR